MHNKNNSNSNPVQHGVPALTSTSSGASACKGDKRRKQVSANMPDNAERTEASERASDIAQSANAPRQAPAVEPVADPDRTETKITPLNDHEKLDLARCEKAIATSQIATWEALAEINEKRLYRGKYSSFEEYCEKEWEISRAYAYRLLKAHGTRANVSPIGDNLITKEAHARVISDLMVEEQKKACEIVKDKVGSRKPKTKDFEEARKQVRPDTIAKKEAVNERARAEADAGKEAAREPDSSSNVVPLDVVETEKREEPNIPSFRELAKMAERARNIFADKTRHAETSQLLSKLKCWLEVRADQEEKSVSVDQQEAA